MRMWGAMQTARVGLSLVSFLFLHMAVIREAYGVAIMIAFTVAAANAAFEFRTRGSRQARSALLVCAAALLCAEIALLWGYPGAILVLIAPPLFINGFLLFFFGRTLLPGREPLITRFRRLEKGQVAAPFVSYTLRITQLWTLLFATTIGLALMAALMGDLGLWSSISLIYMPVAMAAFFAGEHAYRALRFGAEGRTSPLQTLRFLAHPDVWSVGDDVGRT